MGPKITKEKYRKTIEEEHDQLRVVLNIHNRIPASHELFSHASKTVHSIELKENEECFRYHYPEKELMLSLYSRIYSLLKICCHFEASAKGRCIGK